MLFLVDNTNAFVYGNIFTTYIGWAVSYLKFPFNRIASKEAHPADDFTVLDELLLIDAIRPSN